MQNQGNSSKKLTDLKVSAEFIAQAEKLDLYTLHDVLHMDLRRMQAQEDFDYVWYAELLQILKNEDLLREFQDRLFYK